MHRESEIRCLELVMLMLYMGYPFVFGRHQAKNLYMIIPLSSEHLSIGVFAYKELHEGRKEGFHTLYLVAFQK